MGRKVSDGKAFNAASPSGQVINDYDLYRIGGWNGCAVVAKDAVQTDRMQAFECDPAAIYSIKVPAALAPAAGDKLFWATNDVTTFQRGDTNLIAKAAAANGQLPCFFVMKTKNAAGYVQGRVLQSPGDAIKFGT
jgi:hypothetical protein